MALRAILQNDYNPLKGNYIICGLSLVWRSLDFISINPATCAETANTVRETNGYQTALKKPFTCKSSIGLTMGLILN